MTRPPSLRLVTPTTEVPDGAVSWREVRADLLTIIYTHPTENGHVAVAPNRCEYFKDSSLRQPSCIVGHWLDRHRELLDTDCVRRPVRDNESAEFLADLLPDEEAAQLLIDAQQFQDDVVVPWSVRPEPDGVSLQEFIEAWEPAHTGFMEQGGVER
jgi:hypothetical protein